MLALATKLTGEPTWVPLLGLLTVTPAQAEATKATKRKMSAQSLYMAAEFPQFVGFFFLKWALDDRRLPEILVTWSSHRKTKNQSRQSEVQAAPEGLGNQGMME
ncbi:MAG: hypothetical protein WA637_03450 [Terriglobales bacterium]